MIKIYTTENCKNCDKAKEYFKSNGIPYEEINLKEKDNREARAYYRSLGLTTLPVIVIGEEIIPEFDEDMIKDIMEKENGKGR